MIAQPRRLGLTALLLGAAWISMARADDTSTGLMLPALQADPPGSVQATTASVDLVGDRISVALTLHKTSAKAAALTLQGPRFGWLGESEPYPDRQFPELQMAVDETRITPDEGFSAVVEQKDVTSSIRAAGLDPFVIATSPPFVDAPAGSARTAFDQLLSLKAVQSVDGQFMARWQARRLLRVNLGEKPDTVLSMTYRARPGFALMPFRSLARTIKLDAYCVTAPTLAEHLGRTEEAGNVVARTYDISAGIDGRAAERTGVRITSKSAVFCGSAGEAVFGGANAERRPARLDAKGVLHVLEIVPPG